MTYEQKQQLTFLHHALWSFAKELPQEEAILIAKISEFRNSIESKVEQNEERYSRCLAKGGILLLNNTILF